MEMQNAESRMKNWRAALVLPQAHWVLEARLRCWRSTRKLPAFFFFHSAV